MSHPSDSLAIYLLGPPRLERNGQPVTVETRKAIALLAYLALRQERVSRDQLAAFFWPEYDQARAYANLRRTLWALHKALGEGWLAADNLTLELRQQEGVWVDVVEFQQLLAQCAAHGHRSDESCAACLEPLGQAVSLVRGDFLEGFSLRDSAPFDDWHFFEAESLRKQVATSLEKLVRGHSSQQEAETAIDYARRWLVLDPLHEPAHRWLMQLYAQTSEQAAALRQYQECVRILKAELDAPPEAETTTLYERIRSKQLAPRPAKTSPTVTSAPPPTDVQPPSVSTSPVPVSPAPTAVVEDELRMVTVLCAALTEPLTTTPSYPSAQRAQQMQRILQEAEAILRRYDGRVERILGEGVVAIFGSRQLHEDDPERAVRAALDLREAAQQAGLQMSAGLTSGHLYLSRQGGESTTSGPVVHVALRLQAKADADQLLVSEPVYRQTRGVAVYTLSTLALPSPNRPLPVYQLECLQPNPQKVRGIAGLNAPLVGRHKELTTLQEALATLHQGEGHLVTLIGEAGLGKSRLVSELKCGVQNAECGIAEQNHSALLWLEGRCLEMSMAASYWPFLDILRTWLGWQTEGGAASRAGRIVRALDELVASGALTVEQREEMGPLLGNLLAVRFGNVWDERLKFAGPEQIRHQTLMTLRDLLVAIAQQQPLVLVLEDLHWADSLSLDLLTLLMETLAEQPLLLLCVYRPEQQHRCWQLPTLAAAKCPDHFTEVRLRELTNKQSQQLVEALLTIENLTPKVKTTILQKAQGNPLFVEEVIRSLIDAGIVYRQGEMWRAKEEIENVVVPETVQSVILSRVDRLGDTLKSLLQRAAVIGRVFGQRLLTQLAPAGLELDNALSTLTNHAFIYQERVVPEEEYSFNHVLVQEAVYQTTLSERREQLHRQVGEALEQLYADNLAERYEQLAYHYDRSGVAEKAIEYLLQAGDRARTLYAQQEAIAAYQRALALLKYQGDYARAGRTLMKLGLTYHLAFDFVQAQQVYEEGFALWQRMDQFQGEALPPAPHAFRWAGFEPLTLDPANVWEMDSTVFIDQLFSGLVALSPELDIVPDLARTWEVLESGRKYVFYLRHDACWSDGTSLTAEDFVYAWRRVLTSGTTAMYTTTLYVIQGARALHEGHLADPDQLGVRARDAWTLEVELEEPTSYFLHLLTCCPTYPMPRHAIERHGSAWAAVAQLVNNGPFRLDAWQPGQSMLFSRNPHYHGQFTGNVQQVHFFHMPDIKDQLAHYEANGLDILLIWSSDLINRVRQRVTTDLVMAPFLSTFYLGFGLIEAPMDNVRVRQALACAIDREMLANLVMHGWFLPALGGVIPPGMPGHSPGIALPYDPEQARQLLATAGYPGGRGFPCLKLLAPLGTELAQDYLQAQWQAQLGIEVNCESTDWESWSTRARDETSHLFLDHSAAEFPDPYTFLWKLIDDLGWHDTAFTSLLDQARRTMDQTERLKFYAQADRILIQEVGVLPLAYRRGIYLLKPWVKQYPVSAVLNWFWKDIILEPH